MGKIKDMFLECFSYYDICLDEDECESSRRHKLTEGEFLGFHTEFDNLKWRVTMLEEKLKNKNAKA